MGKEEQTRFRCRQCRREIQFGGDLWTVEKGVNGPHGVVPLGNVLVFCRETCVSKYFNNEIDIEHDPGFPGRQPY